MVITKLMGGMGNQMFQFALGHLLAKHLQTEVYVDLSFLNNTSHISNFVQRKYCLDIFNYDIKQYNENIITRKLFNITEDNEHNTIEDICLFSEGIHNKYDIYLTGYFQKHTYTDSIKNDLKTIFTLKSEFSNTTKKLASEISLNNSICVNFRREFGGSQENAKNIEAPSANSFHGIYGMDYFEKAIKYVENDTKIDKIYVFSDDIAWCQENFTSKHPFEIINHTYKGDKFGQYLSLMSLCKHFIIPNSSFAWWAAYLSENENKIIISPKKWFNEPNINTENICPPDWIRI
jgi:hypothetical protein